MTDFEVGPVTYGTMAVWMVNTNFSTIAGNNMWSFYNDGSVGNGIRMKDASNNTKMVKCLL